MKYFIEKSNCTKASPPTNGYKLYKSNLCDCDLTFEFSQIS